MADTIEWVSFRKLISLIASRPENEIETKKVIADRIRDGALKVKAGLIREGLAFGPVSWDPPKHLSPARVTLIGQKPILENQIVDPLVWLKSDDWENDVSQWRWGSGSLILTYAIGKSRRQRIQMWNCLAEWTEVASLSEVETTTAPVATASTPSRRGRPRSTAWNDWIAALVDLVYGGNVPAGCSTARLIELVNGKLEAEGRGPLEPGKVYDAASAVVKRLNGR